MTIMVTVDDYMRQPMEWREQVHQWLKAHGFPVVTEGENTMWYIPRYELIDEGQVRIYYLETMPSGNRVRIKTEWVNGQKVPIERFLDIYSNTPPPIPERNINGPRG